MNKHGKVKKVEVVNPQGCKLGCEYCPHPTVRITYKDGRVAWRVYIWRVFEFHALGK